MNVPISGWLSRGQNCTSPIKYCSKLDGLISGWLSRRRTMCSYRGLTVYVISGKNRVIGAHHALWTSSGVTQFHVAFADLICMWTRRQRSQRHVEIRACLLFILLKRTTMSEEAISSLWLSVSGPLPTTAIRVAGL